MLVLMGLILSLGACWRRPCNIPASHLVDYQAVWTCTALLVILMSLVQVPPLDYTEVAACREINSKVSFALRDFDR